jgi:hypothetical protein
VSQNPIPFSSTTLSEARRLARRQARVDRIYLMLGTSGLAAIGIVAIAGTMLTNMF